MPFLKNTTLLGFRGKFNTAINSTNSYKIKESIYNWVQQYCNLLHVAKHINNIYLFEVFIWHLFHFFQLQLQFARSIIHLDKKFLDQRQGIHPLFAPDSRKPHLRNFFRIQSSTHHRLVAPLFSQNCVPCLRSSRIYSINLITLYCLQFLFLVY